MMKGIRFNDKKELHMFDGDIFAAQQVIKIIQGEKCSDFIETGTFRGGTSLGIREAFPDIRVWTIEADEQLYLAANRRFSAKNIYNFLGDSLPILSKHVLPKLGMRPFFFLDSHVSAFNVSQNPALTEHYPLKDELRLVAWVNHLRPIIMIHDFYNPNHPEYSFDSDHGIPLSIDYIKEELELLGISKGYFFNEEATGNKNGIVYIGVAKQE